MKKILAILLIATPMIFSSVKVESENQCQHGPLDGDKNRACGDNYNYNSATKACWCTKEFSGIRKCNDASYSKEDACPPPKNNFGGKTGKVPNWGKNNAQRNYSL